MKRIISASAAGFATCLALGALPVLEAEATQLPIVVLEDHSAEEYAIFNEINGIRTQHGLAPLMWSPYLADMSRSWAQTSAARARLAHDPMALELADMENVAVMYNSPYDAVPAWMASPSHRANILSPYATSLGVGIARNYLTGGYYITMRGDF